MSEIILSGPPGPPKLGVPVITGSGSGVHPGGGVLGNGSRAAREPVDEEGSR